MHSVKEVLDVHSRIQQGRTKGGEIHLVENEVLKRLLERGREGGGGGGGGGEEGERMCHYDILILYVLFH